MLTEVEVRFDEALTNIADTLDIPVNRYEDAVAKYEAVGSWLDADDSLLHIHKPEIYAQGSFRLGTVVRPLPGRDEYDIDLVCHLEIDKKNISQEELTSMVGERLKSDENYKRMLEPGRRCWTLHYVDAFHMDILPAIPDYEKGNDSILITDKKLKTWQPSNPKGYARWFKEQMKGMFSQRAQLLAESLKANVQDVPEWKVKTPLQRAIQILKRHRDIHFKGDEDDKPVSIIITTLAAHAYDSEDSIYEALVNITENMPTYILYENGTAWVPNPTDPEENFADKWQEYPIRRKKFLAWLGQVSSDLEKALHQESSKEPHKVLENSLGVVIADEALEHSAHAFSNVQFITKPRRQEQIKEVRPIKPWSISV